MIQVSVVSDFNADLVARYLSAGRTPPLCQAVASPFGQAYQALKVEPPGGRESMVLVWTRPEGVVASWQRHLDGERVALGELLDGVDLFASAVLAHSERCRFLLVAGWVPARLSRGLGIRDWSADGDAFRLAQMNLRLAERVAGSRRVFMLDAQRWIDAARPARDGKYWYSIKSPFTEGVCAAAAHDVRSAVRNVLGENRKLIVVDLDNTLWGGVVGDDGWRNLRIGGHDPVGEAFGDFQRALLALSRRGIVLAISSKNDEATALEAIDQHPEMILRRHHFAAWRIDWSDKARNIESLAKELNLGLQSAVFIDDSPSERGRVREALDQVLVPDWPDDPSRFADALRQMDCFDQSAMTEEDAARAAMYVTERHRREASAESTSEEDWLDTLGVRVDLAPVTEGNVKRVAQLLNKTNQMNLRTRRLAEDEFSDWLRGDGRGALALTVRDRFGDIGLTGVLTWQEIGRELEIVDFILSCRAMGRRVEPLMLALAVETARAGGKDHVLAPLHRTERNGPCLEFWRASGCEEPEPNLFLWQAGVAYPRPGAIDVIDGRG